MIQTQKGYTKDPLQEILERNDRELHAFKQLSPVEQARYQAQKYLLYGADPWAFLKECVYTLNQISTEVSAIQPFPSHLDYIHFITDLFQKEPLIAIPKSRRMVCSWSCISLYTHDTIFKEGRFNAFVSKKEEDAGELVSRAEFIYNKIPEWRIPRLLLPKIKGGKMTKEPWVLEFEDTHSLIRAFPQGADQMRQFTISGILGDESAFWQFAKKFYSASKPTIDGGGRMTLISSRAQGFFKQIVFDKMDALDLDFPEIPPVPISTPMEGVEVWRNPKNKFVVVDLHYTADPAKRGIAWREAKRSSMPAKDFQQEYEKNWQTFSENPVFEDFNKDTHVRKGQIELEAHLPLLLAFTFGPTPSCIIGQVVGRSVKVHKEFQERGSITKLAQMVWTYLNLNCQHWLHDDSKIYVFAHPDGFEKQDTDEFSCVQVLRNSGFKNVRPGEPVWETRKLALESYLTKIYHDGPGFQVAQECSVLIEALAGGYRYKESSGDEEVGAPIKDKYLRIAECALFLCAAVSKSTKLKNITIPSPSYGFQSK